MDFITMLANLWTSASQIEIAVIHIHCLSYMHLSCISHVLVYQRIDSCQFRPMIQHTQRPKQFSKRGQLYQTLLFHHHNFYNLHYIFFELDIVVVEDSLGMDDI